KLLLETCSTVADVPLEMVTGFECLICHRADNFFHRKHASGMPGLLLRRAVRGNPVGNHLLLVGVGGHLRGRLPLAPFFERPKVGTPATIGFGRHKSRRSPVLAHIKQQTTAWRVDEAPLRRGWRPAHGALSRVGQERTGHFVVPLLFGISLSSACGAAFGVEGMIELMIASCFTE